MRIYTAIGVERDEATGHAVPGPRHWLGRGGDYENNYEITACGLGSAGMVGEVLTSPELATRRIDCPECQVAFAAWYLAREKCEACRGTGRVTLPPTRGMRDCRSCQGTGHAP